MQNGLQNGKWENYLFMSERERAFHNMVIDAIILEPRNRDGSARWAEKKKKRKSHSIFSFDAASCQSEQARDGDVMCDRSSAVCFVCLSLITRTGSLADLGDWVCFHYCSKETHNSGKEVSSLGRAPSFLKACKAEDGQLALVSHRH